MTYRSLKVVKNERQSRDSTFSFLSGANVTTAAAMLFGRNEAEMFFTVQLPALKNCA